MRKLFSEPWGSLAGRYCSRQPVSASSTSAAHSSEQSTLPERSEGRGVGPVALALVKVVGAWRADGRLAHIARSRTTTPYLRILEDGKCEPRHGRREQREPQHPQSCNYADGGRYPDAGSGCEAAHGGARPKDSS